MDSKKTASQTTQDELLQLQSNTEKINTNNQHSSEELVERHNYPNTGFLIVGNKEKGYFVALGQHRLTEFQTYGECETAITEKNWDLIVNVISIFAHESAKQILNEKTETNV